MAQRLTIINNIPDGAGWKLTSAVHYRWGGYTRVALDEVAYLSGQLEYEFDKPNKFKLEPTDRFNLAFLESVSGMTSDLEKSIDYIEELTGAHYDTSNVTASEGVIAFDQKEIQKLIECAAYVVEIFWKFDEYGQPDMEQTTFSLSELTNYYSDEHELEEYAGMTDDEIDDIKRQKYHFDNVHIKISDAERLSNEIPDAWYDPVEDAFFTTIY
jgi:hypothetical protein